MAIDWFLCARTNGSYNLKFPNEIERNISVDSYCALIKEVNLRTCFDLIRKLLTLLLSWIFLAFVD